MRLAPLAAAVLALPAHAAPPAGSLLAPPVDQPIHGMSWDALSPDGASVCFTWRGDLWVAPVRGGEARRVTVNEALDAAPRWSPDGKWIAFTSMRTGNADIFLVPSAGGETRQVTYHSAPDWMNDWSPDGTHLLFYSRRDTAAFQLYSIDLNTRAVKQVTHGRYPARFGAWSPDGRRVAWTRDGQPWWRPLYHGSVAAQTMVKDLQTGAETAVLPNRSQQFWPVWAHDGRSLVVATMLADDTAANLWRIPLGGGKPQRITAWKDDATRYPSGSANGAELAYVRNGDLHVLRPDGRDDHVVRITAPSDDTVNNEERTTLTGEATEMEPSPDGRQIVLVVRNNLWLMPAAGGDMQQLTHDVALFGDVSWSPDGAKLVFISDRGGYPKVFTLDMKSHAIAQVTDGQDTDSQPQFSPDGATISFARAGRTPGLYTVRAAGGAPAKLADGDGINQNGSGIVSHAWSPDSAWIAFSRSDRWGSVDVWLVPAAGGIPVNVTKWPVANADPEFTHDGKGLMFVSNRGGLPALYRIPLVQREDAAAKAPAKNVTVDLTDITDRAVQVSPPAGPLLDYALTPDGQRVVANIGGSYFLFPATGGAAQQLTRGGAGGSLRIRGEAPRYLFLGQGGTVHAGSLQGSEDQQIAFTAPYTVDRRDLYRKALDEFFARFGGAFYDPKLHGADWPALRLKYAAMLPGVGTPDEFAYLLQMMVGEVNSSHSEIAPAPPTGGPQTASLGLRFDDAWPGPGLRVTSVVEKGPCGVTESRVRPGEYLLSVNGTPVSNDETWWRALTDRAGKPTDLVVGPHASLDGSRTVTVKPATDTAIADLRYAAEVREARSITSTVSGGRVGYIRVRAFNAEAVRDFIRDLWSDGADRQAVVIDIRENGGGNTHDAILEAISRPVYGYRQPRDAGRQTQPTRAWTKPLVLLVNQHSYSDSEIFAAAFRTLKLGPIVGTETPGYVIGTRDETLVDGTHYRLPEIGWFFKDGRDLENAGVEPDTAISDDGMDLAAGKDPQLEAAVRMALLRIAAP